MNPITRRVLDTCGYSLWFVALFAVLTWLTFPWSRVRDQAIVAAADAGTSLQLDAVRLSPWGIKAKGLAVGSGAVDSQPWISFDKLSIGTSASGLLSAALAARSMTGPSAPSNSAETSHLFLESLGDVTVDGELYGGELELRAESDSEVSRITSNLDKVNLENYRVALRTFSANPTGRLNGSSDVTWHWQDAKKSSGNIDLVANSLVFQGLTVAGFGLPETAFNRSEMHIKINRGRAELRDTVFDSDVIQVVVEGYANLNTQLSRSRLALRLRFKVRDDLDGLLKVQFGSNPRHKDSKGWYHYQVNGTVSRPRLRESPAAARRGRKPSPAATAPASAPVAAPRAQSEPGTDPGAAGDSQPVGDIRRKELDEERERLREERTRRRDDRRNKREELIKKRNSRQADLDSEEGSPGTGEDTIIDDEELRRSNFKEGEGEGEEEEPEGEEEEPEGESEEE